MITYLLIMKLIDQRIAYCIVSSLLIDCARDTRIMVHIQGSTLDINSMENNPEQKGQGFPTRLEIHGPGS